MNIQKIGEAHGIRVVKWVTDYITKNGMVCTLCKTLQQTLDIDHNHTTGKIRGLLCIACNAAVSTKWENEEWKKRALEYIVNQTDMDYAPGKHVLLERGEHINQEAEMKKENLNPPKFTLKVICHSCNNEQVHKARSVGWAQKKAYDIWCKCLNA